MKTSDKTLLRHVALPLLAPAAIVALYFTPVDVFGCTTRGLMALGIASLSAVLAVGAAMRAVMLSRAGARSAWWLVSALILILPLILLIWPLG